MVGLFIDGRSVLLFTDLAENQCIRINADLFSVVNITGDYVEVSEWPLTGDPPFTITRPRWSDKYAHKASIRSKQSEGAPMSATAIARRRQAIELRQQRKSIAEVAVRMDISPSCVTKLLKTALSLGETTEEEIPNLKQRH